MSKSSRMSKLLIVVGVQKAGTSSLFSALSLHPGISPAATKEPQFFALQESLVERHIDSYRSLFPPSGHYSLEASTFYFTSPDAPRLIKKFSDDTRILIVTRDPVARAYSGYWHMRKKVLRRERREFREIVDQMQGRDGAIAAREADLVQDAAFEGLIDGDYLGRNYLKDRIEQFSFDATFQDPLWCYRYFTVSSYGRHLRRWRKCFPRRMKVVELESLIRSPKKALQDIYEWLDLDPRKAEMTFPQKNKTRVPRNDWCRFVLGLRRSDNLMKRAAGRVLSVAFRGGLRRPKPELEGPTFKKARDLLRAEYRRRG